jgi:Ca-activated chloride channel homolog
MDLRLDHPGWLWALAGLAPLTLLGAAWFVSMAPLRRVVSVVIRFALVAVLVAALAGLSTAHTDTTFARVVVLDASESVRQYHRGSTGIDAAQRVREVMAAARATLRPDDLLGLVVFDGSSLAVSRPTRADVSARDLTPPGTDGTDIAAALRLARAMLPPQAAARILLVSDGVATSGDAIRAASEAVGDRGQVPIDVAPLRYAITNEVVLESVDVPPTTPRGAPLPVRVVLWASGSAPGTLRVTEGGIAVIERRLVLQPGPNVVRGEYTPSAASVHRLRAVWEPDTQLDPAGVPVAAGDTVAVNNAAEAFSVTPGAGSVLVADGVSSGEPGGAGQTLPRALRDAGIDCEVVPPSGLPRDLLRLQAFDAVVLQNVSAGDVPDDAQQRLASYVSELGGGLVMVGGPESFGPGGWVGSTLEPLIPVQMSIPDVLLTPQAATVLVLDNSGSMRRMVMGTGMSQQEIANDAAALAIRSMQPSDMVGVVTFNSQADVLVPLARNDRWESAVGAVRSIAAGGGTNIGPALELAREQLASAPDGVKVRHVVLLTDGVSRNKQRLPDLARALAKDNIRLTTIAVGDEADLNQLQQLADLGGGAFFHAVNASQLPRIFLKAVRIVRTPLIREEAFEPRLMPVGSPMTAGLGVPPPLEGLVLTRPRPEPTITTAMTTPAGDPLLAHWNVGLGRVVAWTSDAHRWAAPWLETPQYARLWPQIVRAASRPAGDRGIRGSARIDDGMLILRLEARSEAGEPMEGLSVDSTAFTPAGQGLPVRMTQIGPGVFEGRTPIAGGGGALVAVMKPRGPRGALAPVVTGAAVPSGAEFRTLASDEALLTRLAQASGGRVIELDALTPALLFDPAGLAWRQAVTPHWRTLLGWALALFLLDVATRRIAWDRWVSPRFRGDLADAARAASARAEQAVRSVDRLRSVRDTGTDAPAIALGDEEARRLIQQARDRRRAQKLAGVADAARPVEGGAPPAPAPGEPGSGGLKEAKRRAREQFDPDAAP